MIGNRKKVWIFFAFVFIFMIFGKIDTKASDFINPKGKTLEKRIKVPKGYKRVKEKKGSFGKFLRSYPMKKDGSDVLLYDGRKKGNQNAHVAIFKLPLENEDLQQCADAIMRVFGEFYYGRGEYSKINFGIGSKFRADFSIWSKGRGIGISKKGVYWTASKRNDTSYKSFQSFMRMVFAYSGTLNLDSESKKISLKEARAGDIFVKGGSPGHAVMILDVVKNKKGKKAFLLGQSYMPAQEFHVLKNPLHEDNPWYFEEEITYPLYTPEYKFDEGSLRRYK